MFIPFNIKKSTIEAVCGDRQYEYDTEAINTRLRANINLSKISQALIEGTSLQEEWFPSESYDSLFQVFISHAHKDEATVKQLAGYLKEHFGLRCFIDSIYWGYVNDLQKSLDDYYASIKREGKKYYNYDIRNFLTANVHIMLSMALMKMMDACECLIFVDSENSLKYTRGSKGTSSPWIYEEMGFSKRLRVNTPLRYKNRIRVSLKENTNQSTYSFQSMYLQESRQPLFNYKVDMGHFKELTNADFISKTQLGPDEILDKWYSKYDVINRVQSIID